MLRIISKAALACLTVVLAFGATCEKPAPPSQPLTGPGGADYAHASVVESTYGSGATQYWLFEPADPSPAAAPLVIFGHGFSLVDPDLYGAWISHIVRRGSIVIYPRYQSGLLTLPADHLPNATVAIIDALAELQSGGHVTPDLTRVAVVGHSAGGLLAVNIAASAAASGLPVPSAVMAVAPSGPEDSPIGGGEDILEDLSQIPAGTLLLTVAGDDDAIVGDGAARQFYTEADQVAVEDKDFVVVQSDSYGDPALEAKHFEALAGEGDADAIDFYAYWKLFDGLTDAAFYGTNREYALGNTPEQRFMGLWNDGTPVLELIVSDLP